MNEQTIPCATGVPTPARHRKLTVAAALLALAGTAACGGPEATGGDPALDGEQAFVALYREPGDAAVATRASALSANMPSSALSDDGHFYLAIHKRELERRWFLSAYIKQFFPGAANYGPAARTLGTRVVSFKVQNGKLYVFDVDDRKAHSSVFDPEVVVDAYPIIGDFAPFERSPRARDYVLFDPAAGLNRFVLGDITSTPRQFAVQISFSQRFRRLDDGVTFEQVFTGMAPNVIPNVERVENNPFRASGVLGLSLRHYQEGEGFEQTARPLADHYFLGPPSQVANFGGTASVPVKWNIRPGMKPIRWLISDSIDVLEQDPRFAGYDLFGMFERAIESWNEVFGFPVIDAVRAEPGDSFSEDDKNFFVIDLFPQRTGAFANWRVNPNTGEVRGASVYFGSGIIESGHRQLGGPPPTPPPPTTTPPPPPIASDGSFSWPAAPSRAPAPRLLWEAIPDQPLCDLDLAGGAEADPQPGSMPAPLTAREKVERYVGQVAAHEIGHTLGLRHNFKGSLVPPSSSVMDYLTTTDAVAGAHRPGSYDRAALHYLYGISAALPSEPFCTDEATLRDPQCFRFDSTPDPLRLYHGPSYLRALDRALAGDAAARLTADARLDPLLFFVQAGDPTAARDAWNIAFERLRAPASPERIAASPLYGPAVDVMTSRLLSKLFPAPPSETELLRGVMRVPFKPAAPLAAMILPELRNILLDLDGIRSYPSRRLVVDVLKNLQSPAAFEVLRAARVQLVAQRGDAAEGQQALLDDLISRVDRAINPYFVN